MVCPLPPPGGDLCSAKRLTPSCLPSSSQNRFEVATRYVHWFTRCKPTGAFVTFWAFVLQYFGLMKKDSLVSAACDIFAQQAFCEILGIYSSIQTSQPFQGQIIYPHGEHHRKGNLALLQVGRNCQQTQANTGYVKLTSSLTHRAQQTTTVVRVQKFV